MPSIESSLASKFTGFHLTDAPGLKASPVETPIRRNPFLRCPMPPLAPISVDNLDQYDLRGMIPQYRALIGS